MSLCGGVVCHQPDGDTYNVLKTTLFCHMSGMSFAGYVCTCVYFASFQALEIYTFTQV